MPASDRCSHPWTSVFTSWWENVSIHYADLAYCALIFMSAKDKKLRWCDVYFKFWAFWWTLGLFLRTIHDCTCTLRTSSEFCAVSSSICLRSSATASGSAGTRGGWAESVSASQVASSREGEALERFESSFSRGNVKEHQGWKQI